MRYLKLKEAGESVTLTVTACAPATNGKYPGIVFEGDSPEGRVGVELPPSSAQRQLSRLNLDSESVVGQTITISRDPNATNPERPFWGISFSPPATAAKLQPPRRLQPGQENAPLPDSPFPPSETGAPPQAASVKQDGPAKTATGEPEPPDKAQAIEAAYLALFDRVAAHIQKGWGASMPSIRYGSTQTFPCLDLSTAQAATATIFIEQCRRGLL